MIFRRVIWVTAAVLLLALPSAAWWSWPYRLPDPDVCDRDQLYRWMALRDVSIESPEIQSSLVRRFEDLINSGQLGDSVQVDPRFEAQVRMNRDVLQDRWFKDVVTEYGRLAPPERAAFLDRQIHTIECWRMVVGRRPNGDSAAIAKQMDRWLAQVTPNDRAQVIRMIAAGFVRWLATHDLDSVAMSARQAIVSMLSERLAAQSAASSVLTLSEQLDPILPSDTSQLQANGDLLLEAWYHLKAQRFSSIPVEARNEFVASQVEAVQSSPLVPLLNPSGGAAASRSPILMATKLMKAIDTWIQRADSSEQPMLRQFKIAIQQHVLRISFPWFLKKQK